jgi:hypothetical protein
MKTSKIFSFLIYFSISKVFNLWKFRLSLLLGNLYKSGGECVGKKNGWSYGVEIFLKIN